MRAGRHAAAALTALALTTVCGAVAQAAISPADEPGPSHSFAITREGDPGLPDHTLIHPTDLAAVGFALPIVAWANGGCRDTNEEYHYFLTRLASYGVLVVANGDPATPYTGGGIDFTDTNPEKLITAINWAIAANDNPSSKYFRRLDPSRIVVMGQSCGGGEALGAAADSRVTSAILWDQASWNVEGDLSVNQLHAPTAWIDGGATDFWPISRAYYTAAGVPALYGEVTNAGHTGMWDGPNDTCGSPAPCVRDEPLVFAAAWMDLTLYGDPQARAYLLGVNCGLCARSGWSNVMSKSWPAASASPAAPSPAGATPSARANASVCASRRSIVIHLLGIRARDVRSVTVYVNGRRQRTLHGRRGAVLVDLSHRPLGTYHVRLVVSASRGRRTLTRSYLTCTPGSSSRFHGTRGAPS